jgi:hypothetical protein
MLFKPIYSLISFTVLEPLTPSIFAKYIPDVNEEASITNSVALGITDITFLPKIS